MKLEHVALQVEDPVALAAWYVRHLGMRVVREGDPPGHARFLADAAGASVLEVYRGTLPVPDYRAMDPALLHVAFASADVERDRARLLAAGASDVGDVATNAAGDRFAMLRDPWGIPLQLACRTLPLV